MKLKLLVAAVSVALVLCSCADKGPWPEVTVFENYSTGVPYRIPALDINRHGDIIALADYRYCHYDIGFGPIDLHFSISRDLGRSWSAPAVMAAGDSTLAGGWNYAFGDPSIVADSGSDEVLAMSCGGHIVFWDSTRERPQDCVRHRSHDGGKTWTEHEPITGGIYSLFDGRPEGPAQGLFFTSGRILRSSRIKTGKFNRIYSALPVRPGGCYVLYSDDFGGTWHVLGGAGAAPVVSCDEGKCAELPDGSVLLSVRKRGGRAFNIFRYTDGSKAEGSWGKEADALAMEGVNACNGGFTVVQSKNGATLILQSITFQPDRRDVGIFYREWRGDEDNLAEGWKKGIQLTEDTSAYSCLMPMPGGTVACFWENELEDNGYDLVFRRLTLAEITLGEYK